MEFLYLVNDNGIIKLLMLILIAWGRVSYLLVKQNYQLERGELAYLKPIRPINGIIPALLFMVLLTLVINFFRL